MTQQRISLHDLRGMRRAARRRWSRAHRALRVAYQRGSRNAYHDATARETGTRKAYFLVHDELCARLGVEVYP